MSSMGYLTDPLVMCDAAVSFVCQLNYIPMSNLCSCQVKTVGLSL